MLECFDGIGSFEPQNDPNRPHTQAEMWDIPQVRCVPHLLLFLHTDNLCITFRCKDL